VVSISAKEEITMGRKAISVARIEEIRRLISEGQANSGFTNRDLRKIREFLKDRKIELKEAWDEYHS
jgi:hypothetical protein